MDFTTIGTLHSYARIKNLQFAAKHKIKTGQTIASASGRINFSLLGTDRSYVDKMMKASKQSGETINKRRLAAIKRKLMNGKKLSNEEMGFLLKNDSKLYNKAKKAEEAREELKSALSRAKTKSEARKAVLHAMMKASAECTAELDAAKKGGGGGAAPAVGGYEASMDVGGALFSSSQTFSADQTSSGAENNFSDQTFSSAETSSSAETFSSAEKVSDQNIFDQKNTDGQNSFNGKVNAGQSADEKDSPQDILEKYIMVIRALEDEWLTFSKSKRYKELPEDELTDEEALKIKRSEQRTREMISAYRAAMTSAQAQ